MSRRLRAVPLLALLLTLLGGGGAAHADTACHPTDKPDAIAHVTYPGMEQLTYCYGPISIAPGQNVIRLNPSTLFPNRPGYITRFDPELLYTDGTIPRVDVLHLHHGVWLVNGAPQFAAGEEKSIIQMPQGFGWRTVPTDRWQINDMLHNLIDAPAEVYLAWRVDFVPDTSPAAATMKTVHTQWMDVAGPRFWPVFDAKRGFGSGGRYTFPDQATGAQRANIGAAATWRPTHPVTLIGTVGHLHPGGLWTTLSATSGAVTRTIFRSSAHYWEPAGAVSWDVAMGATPSTWRVRLYPGSTLAISATYDVKKASWYESMGIMPVAVYDGTDVGGIDPFAKPKPPVPADQITHGHLAENDQHGGGPTGLPDARRLANGAAPAAPVPIEEYAYQLGGLPLPGAAGLPPTIRAGKTITFRNQDANPLENAFHTITACRAPCNRDTGIAYPLADGPVDFDSGQLGFGPVGMTAAANRDTWTTPSNLPPGTYTYFCRVHPFMRGAFRVISATG